MDPGLTIYNRPNVRAWNFVSLGEGCCAIGRRTFDVSLSHFLNLIVCELGAFGFFSSRLNRPNKFSPFFTALMCVSSFLYLVVNIVFVGSKKKMFRVYTQAVVAFVKHLDFSWYFSNKDVVGKAMAVPSFPEISKTSVSAPKLSSSPYPTPSKVGSMRRNWPIHVYLGCKLLLLRKLKEVFFRVSLVCHTYRDYYTSGNNSIMKERIN